MCSRWCEQLRQKQARPWVQKASFTLFSCFGHKFEFIAFASKHAILFQVTSPSIFEVFSTVNRAIFEWNWMEHDNLNYTSIIDQINVLVWTQL